MKLTVKLLSHHYGRIVLCGVMLTILAIGGLGGAGCTSRNIRRGVTSTSFKNAPLSRFLTLATKDTDFEAGAEPVEFATPVLTENIIYLPTGSRGLEALDRHRLSRRWLFSVKNGVASQPILDNSVLYFGGSDGQFYAVNAELGKVIWKYETKAPVYAKATITNGRVYFTASDDVIYCLDQSTGKWLWHYKRGVNLPTTVRGNAVPLVDLDRVYVGFSDGYFVALNAKDGNLQWEAKIHAGNKFTDVDAEAVGEETRLYIPSYDGGLYALERANGKVLWHTDVGGSKKILIDDKVLYLPSSDGHIYSLNKDTGQSLWSFELDLGTPTNILLHGSYLVFGSSRQYVYVVHKGDGSLAYRTNIGLRSGFFGSPVEDRDQVFMLSNYGNLYGYRWITGSRSKADAKHGEL